MSSAEIEISEWRIPNVSERRDLNEIREVSEAEIERQLVEEGLIQAPCVPERQAEEFARINIGGKPISETIIEERR